MYIFRDIRQDTVAKFSPKNCTTEKKVLEPLIYTNGRQLASPGKQKTGS